MVSLMMGSPQVRATASPTWGRFLDYSCPDILTLLSNTGLRCYHEFLIHSDKQTLIGLDTVCMDFFGVIMKCIALMGR